MNPALIEVEHETCYRYGRAVSLAHHQAHLQPLVDEHQQLAAFDLQIDPVPGHRRDSVDALGNSQSHFELASAHRMLRVRSTSRVRVQARFAALDAGASPAWDEIAAECRYAARAPFEPAVEFVQPSPYVPRLRELHDWALPSFPLGRPAVAAALELMHRLHAGFAYDAASTAVHTPLAQVFAQARGVCQDFAHLMIGALRMLGLPARYASGYLLTRAPEGGAAMLGADASHAWVQLWCPGTPGVPASGAAAGWLDLDPTNDVVPGAGHVRLALGRDFGDVTPLRGVIRGGGEHQLSVAVRTRVLGGAGIAAEPPAAPVRLLQSRQTGNR